jgi:chemotaxis protein MotB
MARRQRHEEHENHERWLVSYADFITLLFAFFTILYATSTHDQKKEEEFEKSVRKYFSGTMGFGATPGQFHTNSDNDSLIEPPITTFPPMSAGPQEVQDHVVRVMKKEINDEDYQQLVEGVMHDTIGVRIQLTGEALFQSGSADIKESAYPALDKIGKLLKDSNRRVIVEGHTDDEAIRTARFPSNWELSALRATKVVRFLLLRDKVPGDHLTAVAYADQKPLAPNTSQENRAKNRRIEILIITNSATPD